MPGTLEAALDKNGDFAVREQGVGTVHRVVRNDTKDVTSSPALTKVSPFDFQAASGAGAQSVMGAVATGRVLVLECTDPSTDAPVQGTLAVNFGSGSVSLTGSLFRIVQATGTITAATFTQSSGSTARVRGHVAGA